MTKSEMPPTRPSDLLFPEAQRVGAIHERRCVNPPFGCGSAIHGEFRDEVSMREFEISGLCQSCQDAVFGGGE